MKSVKFSALMAVAVIAASCAKEGTHSVDESDKVALEPMCIEASDESQTKTVLDGQSVNWTEGDQIAVYSNINYNKGYIFPATDIKGNSATFNGEVPVGTTSFFAVYPLERVVSVNEQGVTVNIPADQTPAEGTFAEEHNITVAQGIKTPGVPSVGTITFNNVCSYVKFTVPAYVSDVNTVTISSDDAIAGDLTVDYTGENPKYTIAADGAKTTISMSGSFGAGKTFLFVIAPGKVSNFSIKIETNSGNWTRTVSTGFTATAGRPVKLGIVDFKIASMDATATHTYADDGVTLTGTNLVIKNLNIPDHLTGYVKNVHIEIIPEGKTDAVRSADIKDFSTQTSIAVNSTTYPYLPKGNYTIKSTYTMSGGTSRETTGSFSVPAPTFSVNTPSAHTSYDTYKNSGAAAANKLDGSTIYGVAGNGVSISDDILNNTKYKSIIRGYSFTIGGKPVTVDVNGNAANQSWNKHDVVAKFTFDGVTKESPALTCHVTGLPYRAPSPTTFNKNWTASQGKQTVVNEKNIVLKSGTGSGAVPTVNLAPFYIPSDKKISCNVNGQYTLISKQFVIWYTTTFKLLLNSSSIISQEGAKANSTQYTMNKDVVLSASANTFSATSSYVLGENVYATIESFNVIYK